MNFRYWILKQTKNNDNIADIAIDIQQDIKDKHLSAKTYQGIRRHMINKHNACDAALDCLDEAYEIYERMIKL